MYSRVDKAGWEQIALTWESQCNSFNENFTDYGVASMPVLQELATGPALRNAAIFSVSGENLEPVAMFHANSAFLPGYNGAVLRIRHITFAPRFDLDETLSLDDYMVALIDVFVSSIAISYKEMVAPHIKFHLKSPAERMFGERFTEALQSRDEIKAVDLRGSWIYISK